MKKTIFLSNLITAMLVSIANIQSSYANSTITMQAATGCFPRVFSQIDFFKSSNGALRNNSETPKTVVCSVHINDFTGSQSNDTLDDFLYVYPYFAFNTDLEDINCTLYLRDADAGNGTGFEESYAMSTLNIAAGWKEDGSFTSSEMLVDIVNNGNRNDSYAYFQCTLPAGVAITQYNIYNN